MLFDSSISFYSPLSKKSDLSIRKYNHKSYFEYRNLIFTLNRRVLYQSVLRHPGGPPDRG